EPVAVGEDNTVVVARPVLPRARAGPGLRLEQLENQLDLLNTELFHRFALNPLLDLVRPALTRCSDREPVRRRPTTSSRPGDDRRRPHDFVAPLGTRLRRDFEHPKPT